MSAAILIPTAVLLRRIPIALGSVVLAIAAVVWVVHPGATRGAVVSLLLIGAVALGAAELLKKEVSRLRYGAAIALAMASQFLLKVPYLLETDLDVVDVARAIALAILGALVTTFLALRWNSQILFLGVAVVVALASGWTVPVILGLYCVLAGELLADTTVDRRLSGGILGATVVAAGLSSLSIGLILLVGGLVALAERKTTLFLVLLLGVPLLSITPSDGGSWVEALSQMAWLPLLLPAVFQPDLRRARRFTLSLLLAFSGLHLLPATDGLVVPLLLLTVTMGENLERRRIQAVWSSTLLVGTLLLGTYPWLRESPLQSVLGVLSLSPNWAEAALVVVLVLLLGAFLSWAGRAGFVKESAASFAALLLLGIGLVKTIPPPGTRLLGNEVLALGFRSNVVLLDSFDPSSVTEIVVDSYVGASVGLPVGTKVAEFRLGRADAECDRWSLEIGAHTGEWAARRFDVAQNPQVVTPSAWLSWIAPGRFFAQRYRAHRILENPCTVTNLSIARNSDLPKRVVLSIFNLELRP
jgi:hypothetical protein